MTHRAKTLLMTMFVAVFVVAGFAATAQAVQNDAATEDVLFMRDGRILHGQILEETRTEIVFEYVDPNISITTKLRLLRIDIEKIERDRVLEVESAEPVITTPTTVEPVEKTAREMRRGRVYGARRGSESNENLTSFYIIPMKGRMGLDVNSQVYMDMVDDIRAHNPDVMIIEMDCADVEDVGFYDITEDAEALDHSGALDDYRDMVRLFRHELGDIPQVLWIKESNGISSVVALAWADMYMSPEAALTGAGKSAINFLRVKNDDNVFGKYREAYMGWLKGLAQNGDYDLVLVDAMVRPEFTLSARWKGRNVEWSTDQSGHVIVDDDDEATVGFSAKAAEDLRISDGTAETLDDLALLLGIREYRIIDGKGDDIFEAHQENWFRVFKAAEQELQDWQKYRGWASGEDTVKYLGRAKTSLEKILAAMNRYKSVETRLGMGGVSRFWVETQIELLKEQIRAARQNAGFGGGGIGGGGGGTSRR